VPTGTASNQIRLGNTAITYAGVQVAWTVTSDRRYKENITPIGLGLGFITKLNPVSYVRKNDENKKTEYGLIAQEVEQVLKELGIENHAMLTITDEGMYELRYNDLIAPMIKAIQELKEKSDEKDIEIAKLKGENEKLISELNNKETRISSVESQLNEIQQVVNELKSKQADIKNVNIGVK
jgi:DNA repair exonuclease SbcCD ATPase subunit